MKRELCVTAAREGDDESSSQYRVSHVRFTRRAWHHRQRRRVKGSRFTEQNTRSAFSITSQARERRRMRMEMKRDLRSLCFPYERRSMSQDALFITARAVHYSESPFPRAPSRKCIAVYEECGDALLGMPRGKCVTAKWSARAIWEAECERARSPSES